VLGGIVNAGGLFETIALTISRWEFLGSLYRGNIRRTGPRDAMAFARRFLEPANALYANVHNLAGRKNRQPNQSDIFTMARDKPLHGANPAAIELENGTGIVTWMMGPGPTGHDHLQVDQFRALHVDATKLYEELLVAMTLFAEYLDQNQERVAGNVIGNHLPQERWLRAAWARFKPHGRGSLVDWMRHGVQYGVPV
jgi:hypothetical protein